MNSPEPRARIALVGASGFGVTHLSNLHRLASQVDLIGIADPARPEVDEKYVAVPRFDSVEELYRRVGVSDITIVSTPIHTHEALASLALEAGSDVYIEKPAVPSRAAFMRLRAVEERTGRLVQVGFQSLGSEGIEFLANGGVGRITSLTATGLWMRDRSYWDRSPWAGRRTLAGNDVVDGVVTNPLAHALVTALRLAGAQDAEDLALIETDLYRANDIESDDTSVINLVTDAGIPITAALTLCAETSQEPYVTVTGTHGRATFWYTKDLIEFDDGTSKTFSRTDLLENLIARRTTETELISPLSSSGAFTEVVEAVRSAPNPRRIDERYLRWVGSGVHTHPVIADIEQWVKRATDEHRTFSSLHAPWSQLTAVTE